MSEFTKNLRNFENMKNDHERIEVSNFYITNYLRENDCCISSEDWKVILSYDYDPWCLIGEVTEHWTNAMKRKVAKIWWKVFKNTEIDVDGMTMTPFMFWPEGICQLDIIEAFKDFFDVDIITDKNFLGMKSIEEGFDMPEKEITYIFENGNRADVFRHGRNDYSVYFHDEDCSVRGSWLEIATEVKNYKAKQVNIIDQTNKTWNKEKEDEMASTSCGRYMNIWATDGAYDCFIKFHEAENDDKVDETIKATEDICHHIMKNKYMKTEAKRKLVDDLLDTYTEFGVGVIIVADKAKERK